MFNNFYQKNNTYKNADNRIGTFSVAVVALIISAISFWFFYNNILPYSRSEYSMIMIPKSEKAALDSEHIIENLKIIPTRLSFYNKLLKDNGNITDQYAGLSDDKRGKLWNETIKVKRAGKSSIIKISVKEKSAGDARNISKAAVSTLLNVASFYYDIKNDIDLRIIEGPVASASSVNLFILIGISLIIGIVISIIISLISSFISNYFSRKKEGSEIKFEKSFFEDKHETESEYRPEEPEPDYKFVEPETVPVEKITKEPLIQTSAKKSSAPENLPFIDEDYFRNNIIKGAITESKKNDTAKSIVAKALVEEKKPENLHREPTKEELKKRLNQLLRGEL